ncbi:MAG: diacylglycerol kinase [Azonexus sp.]|nr:diacylglycerol kinase [Betaproteobacteria bacterium]MBK8916754.1 diacylglycerol kinase [Betaproteobacteria bacterium]MBP6036668.1 diacylglycerol kinase [Azonexus sp.]MBP6907277.1 diacylglycerol kinase [Azonexus sp.]
MDRVVAALGHSLAGLAAAYRGEAAFRQEVWLGIPLAVIAIALPVSALERGLLIASLLLVLIVELLNSAVEATVDRVGLEHHLLSKRAKDIGSAAVLLSLINLAVVWGSVLATRFL